MYIKTFFILIFSLILFTLSCKKKEMGDTVPPGMLSVTEIVPTHGGAVISYKLPDDDDILYVKALYTNSVGNEVYKVSSHYVNSIEIDCFNDTLVHSVSLFVVDQNENISEPVDIEVKPLISHIWLVQQSIEISPDLGSVNITWENQSGKTVYVYLYYDDQNEKELRILSSKKQNESLAVRGLDSVFYDFSVIVEDFCGNKTNEELIGNYKPFFEEKINKDTWTLVEELSVDGNAWEGLTVNFWDDVIDTKDNPNDNSYFIINRDNNGGFLNYPLDIVIDFNKSVKISRFTVWQRAYWYSSQFPDGVSDDYYYYQNENMRKFELSGSNDKEVWVVLDTFDIGDPKDDDGNVPMEYIQEAINGHEFLLDNVTEPFRYLKFGITSSFGSETNVYGSEITLFGLDNVQAE